VVVRVSSSHVLTFQAFSLSFFRGTGPGSIVPDGVVGAQTDPLRDGTVLLLGLGQLLLGAERLVGLYGYMVSEGVCSCICGAGGSPYRHLDGLCRWS
jgi:hypothetical protein